MNVILVLLVSISGIWISPDNNIKLVLHQNGKKLSGSMIANKKVYEISGKTWEEKKCGTWFRVSTIKEIPYGKCKMRLAVSGCGKIKDTSFKTKALILTYLECNGKQQLFFADLSGVWKKSNIP